MPMHIHMPTHIHTHLQTDEHILAGTHGIYAGTNMRKYILVTDCT
jgi:hypothetical protein